MPRPSSGRWTAWFRTGDQGALDDEGYLTLTGRLKEIINRGGEKISPLEVDEVLLDHPAVAQVGRLRRAARKLGEEVAAAVVLREGMAADERELRDFAAQRLADFKVPRRVVILTRSPRVPPASCSASAWPSSWASTAHEDLHLRRRRHRRAAGRELAGRR